MVTAALAARLADYEPGPPLTEARVASWVQQFRPEEQEPILRELEHVLGRLYFPESRVVTALRGLLQRLLAGHDVAQATGRLRFLNVQRFGSSQHQLLQQVDRLLQEEWSCRLSACGHGPPPHTYLYLDDAILTGSRLRADLAARPGRLGTGWLWRGAPAGSRLLIHVLCCHLAGWRRASRALGEAAGSRGVEWGLLSEVDLNNERLPGSEAESVWPETTAVVGARGQWDPTWFRPPGTPAVERFFYSAATRRVLEQAFFREGARLLREAEGAAPPEYRPLGVEFAPGPGLGTLFATHRNCPNTAPLVLWWTRSRNWIPLLPRMDRGRIRNA